MAENNYSIYLTVSNEKQKALSEKLLSGLRERSNLNIVVVPDDASGKRSGSGGAVINIIDRYYKEGKKLLIVNSGGMSKRSVNYAVRGKAFTGVVQNSEEKTLIELIINGAEELMKAVRSGVLICCSDILTDMRSIRVSGKENVGFCIKADAEVASRHGVMIHDSEGNLLKYPHKIDSKKLREYGTELLIDTGVTFFTDELAMKLKELAGSPEYQGLLSHRETEVSLYSDIIALLCSDTDREEYLAAETAGEPHRRIKTVLFEKLSSFSMKVKELPGQSFLHFGSLREAQDNIFGISGSTEKVLSINSYTDSATEVGDNTILDNTHLTACSVGKGCLITDITLEGVSVGDNCSLCGIKLTDGTFVAILCDIAENPKNIEEGISLWSFPRYYKGESFSQSLMKLYNGAEEEKYSMEYCCENADFDYYFSRQQYLRDMNNYTVSEDYLKKREEILHNYFSTRSFCKSFTCLKDRVEINLPLRLNLSGTWTDAMPYCVDNGGQVINMAVSIDGKLPVKVIVEKLQNGQIEFCSDERTVSFNTDHFGNDEDLSDFNLHKAALRTIGFDEDTVINDGFRLTTSVENIDKGSGLGTSSILLGGCLMALGEMFGLEFDETELMKKVFVAEQIMNTGGGWQDQVGGLTPSIKSGSAVAGIEQDLQIDYIELSPFFRKIFAEKLVLLPTGQRHFGRFIVNDVVNRYLSGNRDSLSGHRKIWDLNDELIKAFREDDYCGFLKCINTHRELLKLISPKVTNVSIDKMVDRCFDVAEAVSFLGAGGGGYLLVILKDGISLDEFKTFVKENFPAVTTDVKKPDLFEEECNLH